MKRERKDKKITKWIKKARNICGWTLYQLVQCLDDSEEVPKFVHTPFSELPRTDFQNVKDICEHEYVLACYMDFLNDLQPDLGWDWSDVYFHFFTHDVHFYFGLPRWLSSKESACQCRRCNRHRFKPWVRRIPWGNGHPLQYSCLENPIFTLSDTYFFPYMKRPWDLRLFKEGVIFVVVEVLYWWW